MSSNFIIKETDKNLQFTEFNTVLRPWRLHTTSIYHNRNLVTDPSYSDACYNNLYIESHDNDIRLLVNNSELPDILSKILNRYTILDIEIKEPPIEEIIAKTLSIN